VNRILVATLASLYLTLPAAAEDFSGFYAGIVGSTDVYGRDTYYANAGVVGGYRFGPTDPIRLGVEGRLGIGLERFWTGSLVGTAGVAIESNVFVFGKAGAALQGFVDDPAPYPAGVMPVIGAGIDFAPNDEIIFRVETNLVLRTNAPQLRVHAAEVMFGALKHF
jgi:hypothetical protein